MYDSTKSKVRIIRGKTRKNGTFLHYLSANDPSQLVRVHSLDFIGVEFEVEQLIGLVMLLLQGKLHGAEDLLVIIPQARDCSDRDLFRLSIRPFACLLYTSPSPRD